MPAMMSLSVRITVLALVMVSTMKIRRGNALLAAGKTNTGKNGVVTESNIMSANDLVTRNLRELRNLR